jgi:hypothetical protein
VLVAFSSLNFFREGLLVFALVEHLLVVKREHVSEFVKEKLVAAAGGQNG